MHDGSFRNILKVLPSWAAGDAHQTGHVFLFPAIEFTALEREQRLPLHGRLGAAVRTPLGGRHFSLPTQPENQSPSTSEKADAGSQGLLPQEPFVDVQDTENDPQL